VQTLVHAMGRVRAPCLAFNTSTAALSPAHP
jgi:hypothetical protein